MNRSRAAYKCLLFVAQHPGGTRAPAFPWGWSYRLDAPELKRAPFRTVTINRLFDNGYLFDDGTIRLTPKGERALARWGEHPLTPA